MQFCFCGDRNIPLSWYILATEQHLITCAGRAGARGWDGVGEGVLWTGDIVIFHCEATKPHSSFDFCNSVMCWQSWLRSVVQWLDWLYFYQNRSKVARRPVYPLLQSDFFPCNPSVLPRGTNPSDSLTVTRPSKTICNQTNNCWTVYNPKQWQFGLNFIEEFFQCVT